jgi:predicted transglutaminase-like cysteine proteinase
MRSGLRTKKNAMPSVRSRLCNAIPTALAVALLAACVTHEPGSFAFDFFRAPDPGDRWSGKIAAWQSRERAGSVHGPAPVSGSAAQPVEPGGAAALRTKYAEFRAEQQRALARELARWIQEQSREHYVPDGEVDHWATLEEALARDGDDCDGLELLAYHFLRDLGLPEDEVWRAIVYRPEDGQHHMVTLWFEDPEDPWVIDPTGAMISGMPRFSQVPGWVPLKIFSESEEFSASRIPAPAPGRLASR